MTKISNQRNAPAREKAGVVLTESPPQKRASSASSQANASSPAKKPRVGSEQLTFDFYNKHGGIRTIAAEQSRKLMIEAAEAVARQSLDMEASASAVAKKAKAKIPYATKKGPLVDLDMRDFIKQSKHLTVNEALEESESRFRRLNEKKKEN